MYRSINVDAAVEHLKNIIDSIRCAVCDRTDGTRVRYACGHTSCRECVARASDCSVCLTPPPQSVFRELVVDDPFTQRAAKALNLLDVFQNEFHTDVYTRHRISEQLKAEREVFPHCIQAPAKYINKRKSFQNTKLDKENRLSQIPGEEVSPIRNHKMENRSEHVETWLNKYVRKPFAELDPNATPHKNKAIKKQQNISNIENTPLKKSNRKRPHSKTALSKKNQTLIVDHLTPVKKTKIHNKRENEKINSKAETSKYFNTGNINTDNNESGIVMVDEAVIVVNDSQSVREDKDLNAWLAVQEAECNKQYNSTMATRSLEITSIEEQEDKAIEAEKYIKVPFYLKSYLSDKCIDCNRSNHESETIIKSNNKIPDTEQTKDVSITVENQHFITVIKIQQIGQIKNKTSMQSVEVQTDTVNTKVNENVTNEINHKTPSQDLFHDSEKLEKVKKINLDINKTGNVIVAESDSDEDVEESEVIEVTAEIHRSCEEIDYGILADVDNVGEHSKRARRAPRGDTPTSSNSSEKENYNPNRMKKTTTSKKKPMKK